MHLSIPLKKLSLIALITSSLLACSNTNSSSALSKTSSTTDDSSIVEQLQKNIEASGIDATVLTASKTEISDLYWVTVEDAPSFFADAEGKYIIQGQVIEIGGEEPIDISAKLNAKGTKETLANVDKKELIIFPAKGKTKASIYVFTDPTCPYCRKFDEQVDELNQQGVEVRYIAWPRSAQALPIMESVWCSDDPKQAMRQSMQNLPVPPAKCKSPVRAQIQLGHKIGISGTPAIYNEEGEQLGGFIPTAQLLKILKVESE